MNHLWESTLCTTIVGLLALMLRHNQARVRYWLWLSASIKFLVPFSLLVAVGARIPVPDWTPVGPGASRPSIVIIGPSFAPVGSVLSKRPASPAPPRSNVIPTLLGAAWTCGFFYVLFTWWREWRRIRIALRSGTPFPLDAAIPAISSPLIAEPGVCGIFRPVLVFPEGIADCLTPAQMEAILAHELCHVRRRDNLAATIHMLAEAVFWFHPLVWWLGRRMVEERERACDEEVLEQGNEPQAYAEGILKVCEFCLESTLPCVAGIAGADLHKRVRAIMSTERASQLGMGRKLLLSAAGLAAIAAPISVGIAGASRIEAQSQPVTPLAFEVASVKADKSDGLSGIGLNFHGDRFSAMNMPLQIIISIAYDIPFQSSQLTGGPEWIRRDRFNIEATADKNAFPKGTSFTLRRQKMRWMLQTLLANRFKLTIRRETKELPAYAVVVAKNGPKLQKASIEDQDCTDDSLCHQMQGGRGRGLHGKAIDMSDCLVFFGNWSDRPLVDKTGITGLYDIETGGWAPSIPRDPEAAGNSEEAKAMADPSRPTIFMIFDHLGLKLEARKEPVDMYVIEHVEQPTEN